MKEKRTICSGKKAFLIFSLVLIIISNFNVMPTPRSASEGTKGWFHENFNDNIQLTYLPLNPNSSQRVWVHIESKNDVYIQSAYLEVMVQLFSGENYTGSIDFQRHNNTAMEAIIPPHESGTQVTFSVSAWDEENNVTTSGTYGYTVAGEAYLGWQHEGFENNIDMYYFPTKPKGYQKVTVVIISKEPHVKIEGAYLYIKYKLKGQSEQSGGFIFEEVNATRMVAEIPGYPIGTNVTFWVVAWDKNVEDLTSMEDGYKIETYYYDIYGKEEFPQDIAFGVYIGMVIISILIIYYFLRILKRKESELSNQREG